MRKIILSCCLFVLWGCGKDEGTVTPARLAAPETQRAVASGGVIGFRDAENTFAWLGIPYAQAPVGELRWKAPRAPHTWSGTREVLQFQNTCPQFGGIASNVPEDQYGKLVGAEDCLYLNVWSPQAAQRDKPVPVMVWLYGGGNTQGTASMYDFARVLAGRQQVVVVTLNYRLGIFGWFNHPALIENANDNDGQLLAGDRSGNYGTLDIIQALHWVRGNIAAFGGDAANVTVFGESAGAFNVYTLLASPLAAGLFDKAIAQSGGLKAASAASGQNFNDEIPAGHAASAKELTLALIQADHLATSRDDAKAYLAARSAAEMSAYLRAKSAPELFAVLNTSPEKLGAIELPLVFADGYVLPTALADKSLDNYSLLRPIPLITGTNRDEMRLFQIGDARYVRKWFGVIPQIRDKADYQRSARYGSELWRILGADFPARVQTGAGTPVFVYRFDFDQLKENFFISFSELLGAAHGMDMTYAFGLEESPAAIFKINTDTTRAARQHIAHAMSSYWANFAYTGVPGRGRSGDLPDWQAWSNDDGAPKTLLIDADNRGGIRQIGEELTLLDLKQRLRDDPTLVNDSEALCRTYADVFYRGVFGDVVFDAREYAQLSGGKCPPLVASKAIH